MPRLRLIDYRLSSGPSDVGLCQGDLPGCANAVNSAQRRLLFAREAGDEGWWGSFAEVSFRGVSRSTPYFTTPRNIARVEAANVCDSPIPLNNQFVEYLQFGNGRLPKTCPWMRGPACITQMMTRDNVVTFVDPTLDAFYIRIYAGDSADLNAAKRVLLQGIDTSGQVIYSQDGAMEVEGIFVTLNSPFVQTPIQFSRITGIQKDTTSGTVQIFQVDPTTGDELALVTMEPSETVAGYRRYYFNNLPRNCCNPTLPEENVRVTAIVKLELIPVVVDTDYLLIQNLEAIIEECMAWRMSKMDDARAQQLAQVHHINAVRNLNSEITHYLGKQSPAVGFHPFGSARLERQHIGTML